MQLEEDPSISQVANRFMGTGLLSAPLPGKLKRPLLSAMVRAAGGTVRHRAAAPAAAEGRCQLRHTGARRRYFSDCGSFGARELTAVVPRARWGASSFLLPRPCGEQGGGTAVGSGAGSERSERRWASECSACCALPRCSGAMRSD